MFWKCTIQNKEDQIRSPQFAFCNLEFGIRNMELGNRGWSREFGIQKSEAACVAVAAAAAAAGLLLAGLARLRQ